MGGTDTRHVLHSRTTTGTALAAVVIALAMPAMAQTAEPSVQELLKEIRQRDALIQNLARRVATLEKQVNRRAPAGTSTNRASALPAVSAPAAGVLPTETVSFSEEQSAQAAPQPLGPAVPPPPAATPAPRGTAPGQFEVSPEAAERALERTLVATGNLVVPAGFAEIEPLFSYARREASTQVLFNVNRNELSTGLDARIGLPWESQVEVLLPWNFDEQQQTLAAVAPQQLQSDRWGNAVGDLIIGGAKTFIHESGWIPSVLGRVSWEAPTGPLTANQVPMTSGDNRLSFGLTALRRQDPLVFNASAGYTKAFEANGINPGNQFNFVTGAFLATSPETTLRAVLSQNFVQDVTIHGTTIPGSNSVQPILTFGASSILGRGLLVDLQVGVGLSNAAPKYNVVLSSTYRFGVTGQ